MVIFMSNRNGTIKLYKGIPLAPDYKHVVYYAGVADRDTAFDNYPHTTFTNYSFSKISNNSVKIAADVTIDPIPKWNYIVIDNGLANAIKIYAFITDTRYISDNCFEITYDIDVWQTYVISHFITFGQCFVERTHETTDNYAGNLMPEPISFSKHHIFTRFTTQLTGALTTAIYLLAPWRYDTATNTIIEQYTTNYHEWGAYRYSTFLTYNKFGNNTSGNQDFIACLQTAGAENRLSQIYSVYIAPDNFSANDFQIYRPTSAIIGGKSIKNKKCFISPICKIRLGNFATGAQVDLSPELFTSDTCNFRYVRTIEPGSALICYPRNYMTNNGGKELSVNSPSFPTIAYSGDNYENWVTQQFPMMALKTGGNALLSGLGMMVSPASAMGLLNVGTSAADIGLSALQAHETGDRTMGGISGDTITNFIMGNYEFYADIILPSDDELLAIDEFFTRYGYTVRRTQFLNFRARPHWTFIKTNECVIDYNGGAPSGAVSKIINILNSGVTVWRVMSEIGRYYLDNSPS